MTLNRAAIDDRLSPGRTVYVWYAVGVPLGVGRGFALVDGEALRVGEVLGDGVDLMVGLALGGAALVTAGGLADGVPVGVAAPNLAMAMAANATTRSTTRSTWPASRRAGSDT